MKYISPFSSTFVYFRTGLWYIGEGKLSLLRAFMRQSPLECDCPNRISMEDNAGLIQISNFPNDIVVGSARRLESQYFIVDKAAERADILAVDESRYDQVYHEYSAAHTSRALQ